MANRNDLAAYTSSLVNISEHTELQERLRLYQVFLKLYEQHRSLLNEILDLENSGNSAVGATLPYIQGFASADQGYLVTNLIRGRTQALMQPQQIWVIGRDPQQSLITIQDIRLSRCHAAIKYIANQGFYLIDLESRNQSLVNGEPVRQTLLKDGDQIRLGSLAFTFFLCQSTCVLDALSSDVLERLARCQSPSVETLPDDRATRGSARLEDDTDNLLTLDLHSETSEFLRPKSADFDDV